MNAKLEISLNILRKYDWLLDSYVLDFYVDDHWNKLPLSWRIQFDGINLEHLSALLDVESATNGVQPVVWPLELLALKQLMRNLCINRKQSIKSMLPRCALLKHSKFKHVFTKGVKPKKRHEVEEMAAICASSCAQTKVDFVVDFGAGLGHLARVLGYGYGIKVCCLEMQQNLNAQAVIFDVQFETMAVRHLSEKERSLFQRPTHVTLRLRTETRPDEFISCLIDALNLQNRNFCFGIIGLHPCGDLGATLIRMFLNCSQAKFLNFVGCCYMKLSTCETHPTAMQHGYPLSAFMQHQLTHSKLSYDAREISCHATEAYLDRLKVSDYEYLMVHSYRAAAERIIVQHFPALKHCGLRSVKYASGMSFLEYFYKAVQGLPAAKLDASYLQETTTITDIFHWKRIAIFYTLRLLLAPLVESIILYDRILFLAENDCDVQINAIFDPRLSPRNHVMSAFKSS